MNYTLLHPPTSNLWSPITHSWTATRPSRRFDGFFSFLLRIFTSLHLFFNIFSSRRLVLFSPADCSEIKLKKEHHEEVKVS
ncbi:hypothetical protein LWI29_036574 [Acer saccharum]|uniref:Uncharacterized protein n=1 Tax=Acer saccharum TaxID=4024 RepID=A0AA39SFJ7_ACESA|nr:hypothetical protein LWI29_036574 [Acer saccharum]